MALIMCPECGKEISDTSSICVHCGYDMNNKKTLSCPECGHDIKSGEKLCPNCGYNLQSQKNKKKIFCGVVAVIVVIIIGTLIILLTALSPKEKMIKDSIEALGIKDEEIMTCEIMDTKSEGEYYVYFKTDRQEYMTHVVDGIIESYADERDANREGFNGSKAASQILFKDFTDEDDWEVIEHDVLKKLQ